MVDDADDDAEMWIEHRKQRQRARAVNREKSTKLLSERGVPFQSFNGGAHLQLEVSGVKVDFWPGTGKWIFATNPQIKGRGVFGLLNLIKNTDQV